MADLNKQETTIFNSAAALYNISLSLRTITPNISDTLLFLSDKLLKGIEEKSENKNIDTNTQLNKTLTTDQIKHLETCPDCGGYKEPSNHNELEHCPDCGGIKLESSNISIIEEESYSINEKNSGSCNGHNNDGSGKPMAETNPNKTVHSEKVKNEVKSLIEELRKGLK